MSRFYRSGREEDGIPGTGNAMGKDTEMGALRPRCLRILPGWLEYVGNHS